MLIMLAQIALAISLVAVVLQVAGLEIMEPLYRNSTVLSSDTALVISFLFAFASGAATVMLRVQRSKSRRTKDRFTFPSELHAEWTNHLDELSIPWRYHNEGLCVGGHRMQIRIGEQTMCAVVLNISELSDRAIAKAAGRGCRYPKAILGNYPRRQDGAVGWFQNAPDASWEPIPVSA